MDTVCAFSGHRPERLPWGSDESDPRCQALKIQLEEKLRENGVEDAIIKAIDYCDNVVTVEDMDSDKTVEIHGDDVSYELDEGDRIYV